MKSSDVVAQLVSQLPQFSDRLTTNLSVASITRDSTVLTITTDDEHGLEDGMAISLTGAVEVIGVTCARSGDVGVVVTASDHDLTLLTSKTIVLSGSDDAEYNGVFTVESIPNRRTITFTMTAGPATTTGPSVLEGAESELRRYDGLYRVESVASPRSFNVFHEVTALALPIGAIQVRAQPRISAGVNIGKIIRSYTEQAINEYWVFVVLGDVEASKDRNLRSDAIANTPRGNFYRQQVLQPFGVYLFIPSTEEVAGRQARDDAEDFFLPLCRSILWTKFNSGLASGAQNTVSFSSHGEFSYNDAVYVHEYIFSQVADLTESDCANPDLNVAFRNIDFSLVPNLGTKVSFMTATIDLDDTPL